MIDELVYEVENEIKEQFAKEEKIELANSKKILDAFRKHKISEAHMQGTTGYGYGDLGRDTIEEIYADIITTMETIRCRIAGICIIK